ncbi:MAG TPA: hypothetical protein VMF88_12630 [Bacteroidota bacterium]|nr:hypothetical protein [Bacteroidota bacterium]
MKNYSRWISAFRRSAVGVRRNLRSVLIASLCCMAGCGMIDLKSHWRNRPIVIDGRNTEWGTSLVLLDDKETSIAILNDSDFIYIGLVSTNRNLRNQVARRGMTVWFDVEGGKDQKFGVHYPMGFEAVRPESEAGSDAGSQPSITQSTMPADDLEIEGPGKDDHHPMTFAEAGGIEAKYKIANGVLVYEMKVPLSDRSTSPFTVGAKSGAVIGVGAETSNAKSSPRPTEGVAESGGRGGMGGEGGYGGGGYGGGGRGRRGGGGGGGGRRSSSENQGEPFSTWAKVQLAVFDTSAAK